MRPLDLEVDVLHVLILLYNPQKCRNRPAIWSLEDIEFALRLNCHLRMCLSGVCVVPLAHIVLLLFLLQVTNLFWSQWHRCCALKAIAKALQLKMCRNELLNTNPGSFDVSKAVNQWRKFAPVGYNPIVIYITIALHGSYYTCQDYL